MDAVVALIDTPALSRSSTGAAAPSTQPDASSVAVSFVATQLAAGRATAKPEASHFVTSWRADVGISGQSSKAEFSLGDALRMMSTKFTPAAAFLRTQLCAQMVLAILQYLAPAEQSTMPNAEQEKGFVTILRHAGFHGDSGSAVFEPACGSSLCNLCVMMSGWLSDTGQLLVHTHGQ